jgi:hypothetical protein
MKNTMIPDSFTILVGYLLGAKPAFTDEVGRVGAS